MSLSRFLFLLCAVVTASAQTEHAIVVRAARMVDVAAGRTIRAGEVLVYRK
jgi:hypothetical protein